MHHADVKQHRVRTVYVIAKCRESVSVMLPVLARPKFAKHKQKISSKHKPEKALFAKINLVNSEKLDGKL